MQHVVYSPAERPLVQVLVDGQWCAGDLRMWRQDADGTWAAEVQWHWPEETSHRISTFAATQVRPDETDYSRGRPAN